MRKIDKPAKEKCNGDTLALIRDFGERGESFSEFLMNSTKKNWSFLRI